MTGEIVAVQGGLWPYLLLVVVGFLPSEVWRVLGVFLAQGLDERAEIIVFVRAVATTLLAGVVAKLLISPAGPLALVPTAGRFAGLFVGFAAFFLLRRSVVGGILAAEAFFITLAWWLAPGG